MTIREIATILDAKWISGESNADQQIRYAFASDMMSDVLAFTEMDTMLLTGLVNAQSVRTAEMLDIPCLVFVRGKQPHDDTVRRAIAMDLPTLTTHYSMYEACGRLYAAGVGCLDLQDPDGDSAYDDH